MIKTEKRQDTAKLLTQKVLVLLCAVGSALLISWLIRYSAYGIDFTDESFYLVWMANPFIYKGSITQFGFVYHPLYKTLGGDIGDLRKANIIIIFVLAWGLVHFFLASLVKELKKNRITLLVISAGFASTSFIFFDPWILTPSYNSLNLQALLIASTGLVLAEKNVDFKSVTGWLMIGVGGWLAFMAKPSTALALAVGVSIYLLFANKFSIRMLALTIASLLALLMISALLIDGSPADFTNRLQLGIEFSKILGGGHNLSQILRIDNFQVSTKLLLSILLVAGIIFLALWSMFAKNKKWQTAGLLISIAFFAITALLTLGQVHRAADLGQFQGLLIFAVVYASVITALVLGRLPALKSVTSQQWMIAAIFLVMPHVYAFGTNNNYWQAGSSAAIFWLLAGLTLLGPLIRERASWLFLLPLALAAQTVTATLLKTGLEHPYRQPQPLRLNASNLEIGLQSSALTLSEDYSAYIASAVASTEKAGFEPNTPVIDLSGQSPGILFFVKAKNIGQPWTLGGYSGSLAFMKAGLSSFSCEDISNAWVLFERNGPLNIPIELMAEIGVNFPANYDQVGLWRTAEGVGGYAASRDQQLYKPRFPDKNLANCKKIREEL